MKRILIVDDEASIRNVIAISLAAEGYDVSQAASAQEGFDQIRTTQPNLVILDLGLPDRGGLDVLKQVREWSDVPIIVLTVVDAEASKISLLESGADDYVTKPFSIPELSARIKVALRRGQIESSSPIFTSKNLRVDLSNHEVFNGENKIHLSVTEFSILKMLVRAHGQVVSQKVILSEVWGPLGVENPHYIRIYIGHLRKKIEDDPAAPEHILTEAGVGYRLR